MSGIAGIANVPTTPEDLKVWATTHATHHVNINEAIYQLTGANLPVFVLDPIDPENTSVWEDQHQVMHNNQNQILGIDGFDLSEVDFTNAEYLTGWTQLNFSEHLQASNILGIG